MTELTFAELLRRARACDTCGKPHQPRPRKGVPVMAGSGVIPLAPTWADPGDGHSYDRSSSEFGRVETWLLRQQQEDQ
jgi:hypothetical protein